MNSFEQQLKEGFESDDAYARELTLFIENDGELYRQRTMPIMKNLARKMRKGNYDPMKAVKLWMYLVDDGAKKYTKEMAPDNVWHEMWPKKIRLRSAMDLAEKFEVEVSDGEHDLDQLSMRESKGSTIEISKGQLTEMVRKAIRAQLKEASGSREWELLDRIREAGMGDTEILEELLRALSSHEGVKNLEWIMQMHDIDQEDEEEDEYDDSMDGDFDSGMASAGFGTDEDYGM